MWAYGASARAAEAEDVPPRALKRTGVTLLKREKCDQGYRLYSGRGSEAAHLIDLGGREVHQWSYPQGHSWHYAEMQPDGNLVAIIKDVMILELDWHSKLVWQYKADPPSHFFSQARGSNQRLPNGNTLIAESDPGRCFEVTPQREMVWEFYCPDRHKNGSRMAMYRTLSYPREVVERLLEKYKLPAENR